jgi:hypothetical protein
MDTTGKSIKSGPGCYGGPGGGYLSGVLPHGRPTWKMPPPTLRSESGPLALGALVFSPRHSHSLGQTPEHGALCRDPPASRPDDDSDAMYARCGAGACARMCTRPPFFWKALLLIRIPRERNNGDSEFRFGGPDPSEIVPSEAPPTPGPRGVHQ